MSSRSIRTNELYSVERSLWREPKPAGSAGSYAGLVQHNPFSPTYETFSGRDEPYSLRELAAFVELPLLAPRRKADIHMDGRNVETFDRLRWAYAQIGEYRCGLRETWDEVVAARVLAIDATIVASMDAPGPSELVATQAYYNVTPVNPRVVGVNKSFIFKRSATSKRPIVSAHEVYLGTTRTISSISICRFHWPRNSCMRVHSSRKLGQDFGSHRFTQRCSRMAHRRYRFCAAPYWAAKTPGRF